MEQPTTTREISVDKLPSRGIAYPKGTVITYRSYTFGEIKKASLSTIKGTLPSLQMTLDCITVTGMDKRSITVMDAFYLGFLVKVMSLGGIQFEMPYVCRSCGGSQVLSFHERDIDFRDMDERITELPIVGEVNGRDLDFSPMTVGQFVDLYSGVYNPILKDGVVDGVALSAMACSSLSFKESYDLFYSLTSSEDIEVLKDIDVALMHDIAPLKATCNGKHDNGIACNAENLIKMEGREALLQPFREASGPRKSRIRFSKGAKHVTNGNMSVGIPTCSTNEPEGN